MFLCGVWHRHLVVWSTCLESLQWCYGVDRDILSYAFTWTERSSCYSNSEYTQDIKNVICRDYFQYKPLILSKPYFFLEHFILKIHGCIVVWMDRNADV